jgi:hypothetical protein
MFDYEFKSFTNAAGFVEGGSNSRYSFLPCTGLNFNYRRTTGEKNANQSLLLRRPIEQRR